MFPTSLHGTKEVSNTIGIQVCNYVDSNHYSAQIQCQIMPIYIPIHLAVRLLALFLNALELYLMVASQ